MFWKNVKSLSLVTKLMLLYSVSTVGLLSAIGVFLYPTYVKMMENLHGTEASYITAECYKKLIITLLLASLFTIVFGHFVARKGLKRLKELENTMEKMTADSLHQRINLNDWPKELISFAEKFNTMLDRIQSSFAQLSEFSSDIAHELRTPVHNLRSMTELALINDSTDLKSVLEKQMNEYHHLSKLIENLLFLARSDHGQVILNKEMIDANAVIKQLCEYYQIIADEKQVNLQCVGQASVYVDPTLFKRIISNLISNALKYTPQHGQVVIKIEQQGARVQIAIQDTGVGIAPEHLSRIFDRFYRVDSSRTMQSGGLGLGLAIVKSIVDLHQGEIQIDSAPGSGTRILTIL